MTTVISVYARRPPPVRHSGKGRCETQEETGIRDVSLTLVTKWAFRMQVEHIRLKAHSCDRNDYIVSQSRPWPLFPAMLGQQVHPQMRSSNSSLPSPAFFGEDNLCLTTEELLILTGAQAFLFWACKDVKLYAVVSVGMVCFLLG